MVFVDRGKVEVKTKLGVCEVDGRKRAFQAESRDNARPSLCRIFGLQRMSKTTKWA